MSNIKSVKSFLYAVVTCMSMISLPLISAALPGPNVSPDNQSQQCPKCPECPSCPTCPLCPVQEESPGAGEKSGEVSKDTKVLSYNICFECMSHNSSPDTTAGKLGKICSWTTKDGIKVTECAINIADTIDQTSEYYGGLSRSYDFVGLQEPKNWDSLQKISKALKPLKVVDKNSPVVSLYDGNKYKLTKAIDSRFPGKRPLLISIFDPGVIFVNLHAPHPNKLKPYEHRIAIEDGLSAALASKLNKDEIAKLKDYRIIVTGDFNDHKGVLINDEKNGKFFVPFREAGLMTPVFLSSTDNLGSCCSTTVPYDKRKKLLKGDYIFDSIPKDKFKSVRLKVPSNYNYNLPASDHLPIIYLAQ